MSEGALFVARFLSVQLRLCIAQALFEYFVARFLSVRLRLRIAQNALSHCIYALLAGPPTPGVQRLFVRTDTVELECI